MMLCCESKNGANRGDRRYYCFPYRNPWLVASQLTQITAFLFAYKFMGLFFVGFVAMLMQQLLWCCRQTRTELLISSMLSVLAAGVAIWSGSYVLWNWRDPEWCQPIFFFLFWKPDEIQCGGRDSAALAFVSASLWLVSAAFTMAFVVAATNEADAENNHNHNNNNNNDDYDCELADEDDALLEPITYLSRRAASRKNSVIVSKSEQFAPPEGTYTHTERTSSFKSSVFITKSEQFAPPDGIYTERNQSRKSSAFATKSEQFAPPEGTEEQRQSRKSSIMVSKSEQFAPPEGMEQRPSIRKSSIKVSKSEQFSPPKRKSSVTFSSESEQFVIPFSPDTQTHC